MKSFLSLTLLALAVWTIGQSGPTQKNPPRDLELKPKLKTFIPLDIPFKDDRGRHVKIGDYFGEKPVVLVLVWYKCPGICIMEMEDMARSFSKLKMSLGVDYQALCVSINPNETPALARVVRKQYTDLYGRPGGQAGWNFLIGEKVDIDRLANAIGYKYKYDKITGQYAHPAGIVVLTSKGMISSCILGLDYQQKDLRYALTEAGDGKVGSVLDRAALWCGFIAHDGVTGRYTQNITRIVQAAFLLMFVGVLLSILWMSLRHRRRKLQMPTLPTTGGAER